MVDVPSQSVVWRIYVFIYHAGNEVAGISYDEGLEKTSRLVNIVLKDIDKPLPYNNMKTINI